MNLTRRSIILISLCCGLLAALLAYRYLIKVKARTAQMTQPVRVVVTTQPIPARTIIDSLSVTEELLPIGMIPANCATSVNEVIGQVAVSSLSANVPVPREACAPPTASLGMAYAVPEGSRAVTVALDPIIGVAGFLKPGDRVDVVVTFDVDEIKVTKTVLQDVMLLAIGPDMRPDEVKRPADNRNARPKEQANATLAVTPTQAERLILAEAGGKLRLTLRPSDDRVVVSLDGIRSDSLVGTGSREVVHTASASPQRHSSQASPVKNSTEPPKSLTPVVEAKPPQVEKPPSVVTIRGPQVTITEVGEK